MGCQIASKRDPLFASKNDPPGVLERRVLAGSGALMGIGLLERLERREGEARPEFQPLQQPNPDHRTESRPKRGIPAPKRGRFSTRKGGRV